MTVQLPADHLRRFITEVFNAKGLPDRDAETVSNSLVEASLRGVDSHGIMRVPLYAARLDNGLVNKSPRMRLLKEGSTTAVLDADNAMGQVASRRAMEIAIEKAEQHDTAHVVVRHSNHFGAAAHWAAMALPHQMIGYCTTNGPPVMAAWGGADAVMCNNPVGVAIPSRRPAPMIVDMAMSVAAGGKIRYAARHGLSIPEGWALDANGSPTTDPKAAQDGVLLPFAGHKGYALALIGDVMAGVLSGAAFGSSVGFLWDNATDVQNVGHYFSVTKVAAFLDVDDFLGRVDALTSELSSSRPATGSEGVLIPGDPEWRTQALRQKEGIPVSDSLLADFKSLSKRTGAAFDA